MQRELFPRSRAASPQRGIDVGRRCIATSACQTLGCSQIAYLGAGLMLEVAAAVISAIVGVVGLLVAWGSWRRSELRREDVFGWSNEVIRSLQSLVLITSEKINHSNLDLPQEKIFNVAFDTSILIERGRLLFKNAIMDDFGKGKPLAYQGYRPEILDHIVVAHQVSVEWLNADDEERAYMSKIAKNCLMNFVSLAQKEVGRSRTVSSDARAAGDGANLRYLMSELRRETID